MIVVGTPGDRRADLFGAAARAHGLGEVTVVPWTRVLTGEPLALSGLVRVDSPGESPEADALLRGEGDPTRAGGGATWYARFTAGLGRVASAGGELLADVDEIATMFDKRRCHALLANKGIPVPGGTSVTSYEELREVMRDRSWPRVFVKPAHGSSASGVIAFETAGTRLRAVTSATEDLRNSLAVRTYTEEGTVARIVDTLAPDGLHVERWFPKASVAGGCFDLRVVTVAGEPTHAVARVSRVPMTNLHLGGRRGDLGAIRSRLGERWDEAMDVCARTAACFPGSLTTGVDLMIGTDWRSMAVAEVNAFGDLLPGLGALDGSGLTTYECEAKAIAAGWRSCAT
ncbi:STM4014 family protein [Herbidospora cretacea]|uniref:STM4014 family protein n=1 Tax=Herbidospora cretacea TaxID=28444 RepID=UPI0009EDC20D|nr:STM4014 family protein [Herbidospora cretacea]